MILFINMCEVPPPQFIILIQSLHKKLATILQPFTNEGFIICNLTHQSVVLLFDSSVVSIPIQIILFSCLS